MTTKLTIANLDSSLASILPIVTAVSVCDVNGTVLPDLVLRPTGGHLKLTGSNFVTGCILYVNGLPATATTVISATEVRVQMPALAVGTYSIMLFNTATVAAIWVAGIVYSAAPVWTTSSYSNSGNVVNVQLLTTGDVPLIYSLQAGSTLPTGVTLSSSGLLSGTATEISSTTTVTFTVVVTDLQSQSTPQLISLSMTFYIGKLWMWGRNTNGQLGDNTTINKSSPVQIGAQTEWNLIDGGGQGFTASIKTDGTLWSWGNNSYGPLGLGNTTSYSSPKQIGSLTTWSNVSAGQRHALAVKTDGTMWTWGSNSYGQLGLSNTTYYSSPKQIGSLTTWSSMTLGWSHIAAIKTDGTLWTWGKNGSGQLGLSNSTSYSSPKQIGTLADWVRVSSNYNHTVAIKTNYTLWAWGLNTSGQLGDNTTANKLSPVQIGTLTDWANVSAGFQYTIAIKTNGTLWAWGRNGYGQLGDNTIINRSSPVQVGALTTWTSSDSTLASGLYHNVAIKTDGTLWAWGRNYLGRIGDGTTINRSSPVQLGAITNWLKVSAGNYHSIATRTTGTLWAWGVGWYGQIGDNANTTKTGPTQVGTLTNWLNIGAGSYHSMAVSA